MSTTQLDIKAQIARFELIKKHREFLENFGIDASPEALTDDEVVAKIKLINEAKEMKSEILSRGAVTDSMDFLLSKVEKGFIGQFKRNKPSDIQLAEAQGWRILKDKAIAKASDTPSGTDIVILGDLILMVMPDHEYVGKRLADKQRRKLKREAHTPKKQAEAARVEEIDIREFP